MTNNCLFFSNANEQLSLRFMSVGRVVYVCRENDFDLAISKTSKEFTPSCNSGWQPFFKVVITCYIFVQSWKKVGT